MADLLNLAMLVCAAVGHLEFLRRMQSFAWDLRYSGPSSRR